MSNLRGFFKSEKAVKKNAQYAVSKEFKDEKGKPLKWVIKPITTKENNALREECTVEIPITGRRGQYRQKFNYDKYLIRLLCESVVEPNLNAKELQDDYGVMCAEDLIVEMVDNVSEFNDFVSFVNDFNDFTDINDKVEEAKN